MPYPTDAPETKHDLVLCRGKLPPPDGTSLKEAWRGFTSASQIFHALEQDLPTKESIKLLSSVYSYKDAPSNPPLSRALAILGVAPDIESSSSVIRKLIGNDTPKNLLHKCVIGVKRADGNYMDALNTQNQHNSVQFANLMRRLHYERLVAVLAQDKQGRFALLRPSEEMTLMLDTNTTNNEYQSYDFYAECFVGKVNEVKSYLTRELVEAEAATKQQPKETEGEWQPSTPPMDPPLLPPARDDGTSSNSPEWQPSTPPTDPPPRPPAVAAAAAAAAADNDDEWQPSTPSTEPPPPAAAAGDGDDDDEWTPSTPPTDPPPPPPANDGGDEEWTPSTPPDGPPQWQPSTPPDDDNDNNDGPPLWQPSTPPDEPPPTTAADGDDNTEELWKPPGTSGDNDDSGDLWQPPGTGGDDNGQQGEENGFSWQPPGGDDNNDSNPFGNASTTNAWDTSNNNNMDVDDDGESKKRPRDNDDYDYHENGNNNNKKNEFHADSTAAAADAFYSKLTRTLDTRADSRIFHTRAFNGWVKATQIQELDPKTRGPGRTLNSPMRVLDLACGKGGDLGKWVLHNRGVSNYVGIDVARGSLRDAAIRVRNMGGSKLKRCAFTCADLGADVPGRLKSPKHKHMQKLLTWSLQADDDSSGSDPEFKMMRGGGISLEDRFDVVSIQFAIHYMMSTKKRARRFFQTVSELLEVGGNLIATTIDARVVIGHLMNLGLDVHFDNDDDENDNNNSMGEEEAAVKVGNGACILRFEPKIVKRIFHPPPTTDKDSIDNLLGLEYTFTLVEGTDHEAGVGDAVNLPEWLTPIPVLKQLGEEAGLQLEYTQNFHDFYKARSDPSTNAACHSSLYNMKVLNRNGSISPDEWEISRMYMAVKFRKVHESTMTLDEESDGEEDDDEDDDDDETEIDPAFKAKNLPMAMMKAKKSVGDDAWRALSSDEKTVITQKELRKLAAAAAAQK